MTITQVSSQAGGVTADSTASTTRAFPGNVTSGNLVVAYGSKYDPGSNIFATGNVTKSAGTATIGSFTMHVQLQQPTDTAHNAAVWSAIVTGSGSLTLQLASTAGSYLVFGTDELNSSNGWDSGRQEDTDTGSGNSSTFITGTLTSAGAAAFCGAIALAAGGGNLTDFAQDAAFTRIYRETDSDSHEVGMSMIRIVSSGTTDAIEASSGLFGTQLFTAVGVVLKEASAAVTVGASGSAATGGAGTQVPGISIGL